MTFTDSVKTCFRKYFTFSGRAARSEYWNFLLFLFLGGVVFGLFDALFFEAGTFQSNVAESSFAYSAESGGPLSALFSFGMFMPMLAAGWRRMHDSGRSGLHLLYPMIAIVGLSTFIGLFGGVEILASDDATTLFQSLFGVVTVLALLVVIISPFIVLWWLTRPSQPGQNRYGPNPHEVHP